MRKRCLDTLLRLCSAFLLCVSPVLVSACGDDEDGSDVPAVRVELVDAEVGHDRLVARVVTDDGVTYYPTRDISATQADTLMRCICRYAPEKDGFAQIYSLAAILAPEPRPLSDFKWVSHDPVNIKSVWKAKSLPYVNLHLGVLTSDAGSHNFGFVADSVVAGKSFFSLLHFCPEDDAEAYTRDTYLSLPLTGVPETDSIILHINTYDGLKRYAF